MEHILCDGSGSAASSSLGRRRRSHKIWFDDGNLVLRTSTKEYRLHRGILSAQSTVFRDMLKMPQPQDQELVEGCPVVDVTDSEEEWDTLLSVIYGFRDMVDPVGGVIPFDVLNASLVLGTKYGCERHLSMALAQLEKLFPHTLDEWDCQDASRDPEKPRYTETIELPLLRLIVSYGPRTALPMAYYTCAFKYPNLRILDDQTIVALLDGGDAMRREFYQYILKWCWDGTIPSNSCTRRAQCPKHPPKILGDLLVMNTSVATLLDPFEAYYWTFMDLCEHCQAAASREHSKGRRIVWEHLPSFFGLGEWRNLRS